MKKKVYLKYADSIWITLQILDFFIFFLSLDNIFKLSFWELKKIISSIYWITLGIFKICKKRLP